MASFSMTLLVCTAGVIETWSPATVDRSADAHALDVLQSLLSQPLRQLVDGDDRRAGRARHADDVGRVIRMAVGQQNQVRLVDLRAWRTHRIALEPRVGDDPLAAGRRDDEGGVAEPGDRE